MKKSTLNSVLLLLLVCHAKSQLENKCNTLNPCLNLSECRAYSDNPHDVMCVCFRGFRGNLCEKWPRKCSVDFCLNDGLCVMVKKIPRCKCLPNYEGLFCERLKSTETTTVSTTTHQILFPLNTTNINSNLSTEIDYAENITSTTPIETTETRTPVQSTIPSNDNSTSSVIKENSTSSAPKFENEMTLNQTNQEKSVSLVRKNISLFIHICLFSPCKNGATCTLLNDVPYLFQCECHNGFKGRFCEIPKNEQRNSTGKELKSICDFNPCMNSGECVSVSDTKFECKCLKNSYGILCEHKNETLDKSLLNLNEINYKKSNQIFSVNYNSHLLNLLLE